MIEYGPDGEVVAEAVTVPSEPPASEPARTDTAAFFDVDNTVLQGASIFHLARGLWRRDFFTTRDIAAMLWKQASFAVLGENLEHVAQIREQALGFIAGHTVEEIGRIGQEIYDEVMVDKIWPGTRALAQAHLDAGHDVWLVTATPVEVATVIADRLGLTGALGTVAESVDGVYTGRLVGEFLHGPAKAVAIEALASERGYDLAECSAYSDSANDIPMLSMVGDPCAVNPDAKLRHHAKAHGWRVRDFRNGRKAAKVGIPAAGATALAGALAAAASRRRATR
ncbi:HAD-IB family hydrolase [Phycicoccus sp. SLBN-51]|uniref:HAD family hydrolase n=1 Tax=Phycicoccus sp. SLBN-51 TaxID=2768447 RepID=UPI00114DEAA6|nr:HAD-IB family hydrolase [Phycicoccus sp. SLBN-51]TQJ49427.1 HAD superfamily hydrolase (TIGR01490 family) [Phycicoccus sp. SLBN-51]